MNRRTVVVRPPSRSTEALSWFRSVAGVVLVSALVIASRREGGEAGARHLFPFQVLFEGLESSEQRRFREIREGLMECLGVRSEDGHWPAPETLAYEGVPPFAPHPLDQGRIRWRQIVDGRRIRYLGEAEPPLRSFMVEILEPDSSAVDVSHIRMQVLDEVHRRLDDGTILDVSVWIREGPLPSELAPQPMTQGWLQVLLEATPLPGRP